MRNSYAHVLKIVTIYSRNTALLTESIPNKANDNDNTLYQGLHNCFMHIIRLLVVIGVKGPLIPSIIHM